MFNPLKCKHKRPIAECAECPDPDLERKKRVEGSLFGGLGDGFIGDGAGDVAGDSWPYLKGD